MNNAIIYHPILLQMTERARVVPRMTGLGRARLEPTMTGPGKPTRRTRANRTKPRSTGKTTERARPGKATTTRANPVKWIWIGKTVSFIFCCPLFFFPRGYISNIKIFNQQTRQLIMRTSIQGKSMLILKIVSFFWSKNMIQLSFENFVSHNFFFAFKIDSDSNEEDFTPADEDSSDAESEVEGKDFSPVSIF